MKLIILFVTIVIASISQPVCGQNVAVKTNLLSDAILSPNIGVEIGLAPKWTLDVSGQMNAWTLSHDRRWKHWAIQPEARYWLCDRFSSLKDSRYQGWFVGAGVAYGYAWILSRHWNLEAEIGFGYSYTRYDRFPCAVCGTKLESDKPHHYVGPTKIAINLVYLF